MKTSEEEFLDLWVWEKASDNPNKNSNLVYKEIAALLGAYYEQKTEENLKKIKFNPLKKIMKKLLLTLAIIVLPLMGYGQKDAVSLVYQPQDNGIGVRYDHHINTFGYYLSYSNGLYNGYDIHGNYYRIENHNKYAGGLTIKNKYKPTYFSIGISHHSYGTKVLTPYINEDAFLPTSFELGISTDLSRIRAGFRFDPIKWEGCFEVGFNF